MGRGRFAGAKGKVFNERWTYLSRIQSSISMKSKVLVAQSCLTLGDRMHCSLPGSSVYGILQARILEWYPFSLPGDLPDPGIEARSPALQADSLSSEPPGKPMKKLR